MLSVAWDCDHRPNFKLLMSSTLFVLVRNCKSGCRVLRVVLAKWSSLSKSSVKQPPEFLHLSAGDGFAALSFGCGCSGVNVSSSKFKSGSKSKILNLNGALWTVHRLQKADTHFEPNTADQWTFWSLVQWIPWKVHLLGSIVRLKRLNQVAEIY